MILKVMEQYLFSDPKFSKVKGSMNLTIFACAEISDLSRFNGSPK
jgi:hypothetical protein